MSAFLDMLQIYFFRSQLHIAFIVTPKIYWAAPLNMEIVKSMVWSIKCAVVGNLCTVYIQKERFAVDMDPQKREIHLGIN